MSLENIVCNPNTIFVYICKSPIVQVPKDETEMWKSVVEYIIWFYCIKYCDRVYACSYCVKFCGRIYAWFYFVILCDIFMFILHKINSVVESMPGPIVWNSDVEYMHVPIAWNSVVEYMHGPIVWNSGVEYSWSFCLVLPSYI